MTKGLPSFFANAKIVHSKLPEILSLVYRKLYIYWKIVRFNSHIRKIINSRCFPCTSLNFLINTAFLERLTVRELILSEVHMHTL